MSGAWVASASQIQSEGLMPTSSTAAWVGLRAKCSSGDYVEAVTTSESPAKRHLPVLGGATNSGPSAVQGAVAVASVAFALWLPLSLLGVWIGQASSAWYLATYPPSGAALAVLTAGPAAASFALACGGAATLAQRFDLARGPGSAALGGLVVAVTVWSLAVAAGALRPAAFATFTLVVLAALGATSASAGSTLARLGKSGPKPQRALGSRQE